MIKKKLTFIDLFAGAGGLSEGFIRAGFEPFAHVEIDEAACNTLKTRMARHSLYNSGKPEKIELYKQYLHGNISRNTLWNSVPQKVIDSEFFKAIYCSIFNS